MPMEAILGAALGLSLVYLILSLVCTTIQEIIANYCDSRGKNLKNCITLMLEQNTDQTKIINNTITCAEIVNMTYSHPLISTNSIKDKLPSFIQADHFAIAMIDAINEINKKHHRNIPENIKKLIDYWECSGKNIKDELESWFKNTNDLIIDTYRRRTQLITFIIGASLATALNVDTLQITQALWTQPTLRDNSVKISAAFMEKYSLNLEKCTQDKNDEPCKSTTQILEYLNDLKQLQLPLGWTQKDLEEIQIITTTINVKSTKLRENIFNIAEKIAGLLITALALSMGSQFWFDTLSRFMQVGRVKKQNPKPENISSKKNDKPNDKHNEADAT